MRPTVWIRRAICFGLLVLYGSVCQVHAAEPGFPEKPHWVCARFPSTAPSTVVVDVKVLGGAQIASNSSATQQTLDAVASDYWCIDLNTVSNYAADCTDATYLVRFAPDGANCNVSGGTPSLCVDQIDTSGGQQCRDANDEQTVVYPLVAVPSRGITATVIARGNPSYIKHEVKLDNVGASFTFYDVFYYDAQGRVSQRLRDDAPPSP